MSEDVEISLPEPSHQPPLPAFIPFAPPNHIPWCFPAAVRIIILVGRISDSLNRRDALRRRNSNDTQDVETQNNERRQLLENQLKDFYVALPQELKWSVENLKMHAANGQGGLYLFIHVWCKSNSIRVLILTFYQTTLFSHSYINIKHPDLLSQKTHLKFHSVRPR